MTRIQFIVRRKILLQALGQYRQWISRLMNKGSHVVSNASVFKNRFLALEPCSFPLVAMKQFSILSSNVINMFLSCPSKWSSADVPT